VYITSAGIELWSTKSSDFIHRTNPAVVNGRKLSEGDPPICLVVPDHLEITDGLIEDAQYWRNIRAFAIDSKGKKYLSNKIWLRPNWGKGDGKASLDELKISRVVDGNVERHEIEAMFRDGVLDIDTLLRKHARVLCSTTEMDHQRGGSYMPRVD
jgi:hypothetical protein